jgi:hypothetical protein
MRNKFFNLGTFKHNHFTDVQLPMKKKTLDIQSKCLRNEKNVVDSK